MATYNVGEIIKISAVGSQGADLYVNSFHYRCVGNGLETSVATAFETAYLSLIIAHQHQSLVYDTVQIRSITNPSKGDDVPVSYNGSLTGSRVPQQCAIVASHRTGLIGRSRRGRNYIGALDDAQLGSGGALNTSEKTAIEAIFNGMQIISSGATFVAHFVVYSKTLTSSFDVVTTLVDQNIGTQRRRRPGVGA